jgi:hypothetical protein
VRRHDDRDDATNAGEALVYVVDLRARAIDEAARVSRDEPAGPPPSPPPSPASDVRAVALLLDGRNEPLVVDVPPTRDGRLLDALGRLLKIAVLAGERVPSVAVTYGEEYERTLVFERRLPRWVFDGLDGRTADALPPEIRRVLGPPRRL